MKSDRTALLDSAPLLVGQGTWIDALSGTTGRDTHRVLSQALALQGLGAGLSFDIGAQHQQKRVRWNPDFHAARPAGARINRLVVETSDGIETISGVFFRPVSHTHDNLTEWHDEDGLQVLQTPLNPLLPEDGAMVVDPETSPTWYSLDIPSNDRVVLIETGTQSLLPGVSFVQADAELLFPSHPGDFLAAEVWLVCEAARPDKRTYATGEGSVPALLALQRNNPTTARLQKAAAESAGIFTADVTGTITSVHALPEGARYVVGETELFTTVPHALLSVGQLVNPHTQIGGTLQLFEAGSVSWWLEHDLSAGISLDPLCPVKGLTLPTADLKITATEVGGVVHTRWNGLVGSSMNINRFHNWLDRCTQRTPTPKRLAEVLSLGDGDSVFINAHKLLFEYLLGRRAVLSRYDSIGARGMRIVRENMPASAVLVEYFVP